MPRKSTIQTTRTQPATTDAKRARDFMEGGSPDWARGDRIKSCLVLLASQH